MSVIKVDHLTIFVKNFENSRNFYLKYFNLEDKEVPAAEERSLPSGIIGDQESFFLCIYEVEDSDLVEKIDSSPFRHFGVYHSDFDTIVEKLKNDKIEYLYDGIVDYPKSRSFYIKDPDGYTIELTDTFGGGL